MTRTALLLLPLLASACVDDGPSEPLASAPSSVSVFVTVDADAATSVVDVELGGGASMVESEAGPCFRASDELTATYDDRPMTLVDRGGWQGALDGTYDCAPVQLHLDDVAARPGQPSTIRISDGSATWTIAATDLATADLALTKTPTRAGVPGEITWASAASFLDTPFVTLAGQGDLPEPISNLATDANRVTFNVYVHATPIATIRIDASRRVEATTCEGPTRCTLALSVKRAFALTLQ